MVALFSYKSGSSFLHRTPAWIKLLFIPLINILFLCLPAYFALGLILIQFVVAFCLRFSVKEQLADVKPVLYYAVLLYGFKLILWIISFAGAMNVTEGTDPSAVDSFFTQGAVSLVSFFSIFDSETFFLLVKLFCVMQSASLVFKTSTLLQLREGIGLIESTVRKFLHLKKQNSFTNVISMFLNFIPMLAQIWEQSKKAWIARGGKKGIKMFGVLLPVLFSVGMKKAYNQARAISIREKA